MATMMDWVSASFWNGLGFAIGINMFLPIIYSLQIFPGATMIHNVIAAIGSGLFGVISLNIFTNYLTI